MRTLLFPILFFAFFSFASGQTREEINEFFNEGTFFFNKAEYKEAAYYFKRVVEYNPDNAHYNFKVGECYLNLPGEEVSAVPFFEKAVLQTVTKKKYRDKDFEEKNAPLHAWFYLGNAYRASNRLDDALIAYSTFVNSPFYYGNYNVNIVENEIKSCERAKIIMDSPVIFEETALDTVINTTASEINPVVSAEGKSIAFVRRLKFYDAIFYADRKGDSWNNPVNLNPLVGSDGEFYPVCLSGDGNELYLVKKDLENSDLYVCYRNASTWTKAEPLNSNINTPGQETWGSISPDKETLWFTSSRRGGSGGLDIYYSRKDKNGHWGKAMNAGKMINTPFDDECPCLANDGKSLFFSSKGHNSMGGFDIFYSVFDGKSWGEPRNVGFPVNNTTDNLGFVPLNDGATGYYSRINAEGGTAEDVFRVTLMSNKPVP
jgi:tetratricopeptide (TPR) repeat protein